MLVFDGVDELDAIGPYGVLGTGAAHGAALSVALVTAEPREEVVSDHGVVLRPYGVLDEGADVVIVPGGGWNDRQARGARAEAERGVPPVPSRRATPRARASPTRAWWTTATC